MTRLRVGTRGSELALWQTNWVCDKLRKVHAGLEVEQVIIKTHGDKNQDENFGKSWPVGAFVSALENTLLAGEIDFAVHSYKDLQTADTEGLTIAAVPEREDPQDMLLAADAVNSLNDFPAGARIGTNSPRRAAQLLAMGDFEIVPIRGNVPTRIGKIESEVLHGVVLAAAGLKRLGITHPHVLRLPLDEFLPAPAQGALAVQVRVGSEAEEIVAVINDESSRKAVEAERQVLRTVNAGCHTPVGALATVDGGTVNLKARMFTDDYICCAEGEESGVDPFEVGAKLANRLKSELESG